MRERSATGFATPSLAFCVCNHACLTTKRYGRDYKSRPTVRGNRSPLCKRGVRGDFLNTGLRGPVLQIPLSPPFAKGEAKTLRNINY